MGKWKEAIAELRRRAPEETALFEDSELEIVVRRSYAKNWKQVDWAYAKDLLRFLAACVEPLKERGQW